MPDQLSAVEFKVFSGPANDPKGRVAALRVPGAASMPRSQIDDYTKFVGIYGAKGLAYIKVNERAKGVEGLQSPIVKFIPEDNLNVILDRVGAIDGDIVFFGADKAKIVSEALGALRIKLGHDLKLLTCDWAPLWVVDFPMFENDDGSLSALHHPFTAPKCSPQELEANPSAALSRAYDMVLNGTELGGGSIRIHRKEMQQAVFRILGIDEAEQEEKFGFLLDALKFGAPPHGGLAFGLDRLVMLMTGAQSVAKSSPSRNPERCGRHDPGAGCGGQQGIARPAHPSARAAKGGISATRSTVMRPSSSSAPVVRASRR